MRTVSFHIACVSAILAMGSGCSTPPKAPQDLDDLSRFLYREWPQTDPSEMEAGVTNLQAFLAPLAAKGKLTQNIGTGNRSWTLSTLQTSDLQGITPPPGADPTKCYAVAVAWKSSFGMADHVNLQLQTSQLPAEPTASNYVRSFINPTDPSCFVNQGCQVMNTSNDITRNNPLGSVRLNPALKSFKWIPLTFPGGSGWAIIARTWIEQVMPGSGGAAVTQSYVVDAWLFVSPTETWRYQVNYSASSPDLGADIELPVLQTGIDENLQGDDMAIQKLFHS